jgi:TRAP-type C4-dicarboxylate transport system permease large subunit
VDPVVAKLGIDPNQLAMIVVYNLTLCIIAPRVGGLLFVMSSDSRVPMGPLVRERVPF